MTIAEVSRQFDITPDTLRYYERIGLIPPVPRTKSGIRDYDQTSCSWIEFIKCMRAAGLQIEALIEYVALFQQGDSTIGARKAPVSYTHLVPSAFTVNTYCSLLLPVRMDSVGTEIVLARRSV